MPKIFRDPRLYFPIGFIFFLFLLSIFLPLMPAFNPLAFDPNTVSGPQAPNWHHWLGTDELGRDVFSRLVSGGRVSLSIGFLASSISVSVGLFFGLISGFLGGIFDRVFMRVVDMLMALPTLMMILIVQTLVPPSIYTVVVIIGLTSWMESCRIVRGEVLSLKRQPFILAAQSRGLSGRRILFRHVLPHTLGPLIVVAIFSMSGAILAESVISFLGLGVQPPAASWGTMLENSLTYIWDSPWMIIAPGAIITITVLMINLIGDTLRSYLNPKEQVC